MAATQGLSPSLCQEPICRGSSWLNTIQIYLYVHNKEKWLCCQHQSFNLMLPTPL